MAAGGSNTSTSWKLDFSSVDGIRPNTKLDPPGYTATSAREWVAGTPAQSKRRDPKLIEKKQQALWEAARAPAKQVAFMCFMMYMMGSGIQIFSIIMVMSGLAAPVMAILRSGQAFPRDPERKLDTLAPRLLFCIIQAAQFAFALNRLNAMGLLPTHASDWLSSVAAPVSVESAHGPL